MTSSTKSTDTKPKANILVFDSGVGGLSIADEIQRQLPHCHINYCSDNAAFPYGVKGEKELIERVEKVLKAACEKYTADIIVIACNSASTLALPHIRNHFSQPIVGVVPAIKPAAAVSNSKRLGLLATPGTVSRAYTQKLIEDFANNCHITQVGSSELVVLAERKLRGDSISGAQLQPILQPFIDQRVDTLILACTHFPLLKKEIQHCLGSRVTLIDSANAIAKRVEFLLTKINPVETSSNNHKSIFTAQNKEVEALRDALNKYGLANIEYIVV